MNAPDELKSAYSQGRLVIFVGAGLPMSIQWTVGSERLRGPSWGELVDQACGILGFEDAELARVRGTDLQILEYFKLKHDGESARLTNWLTRLMDAPDAALSDSPLLKELSALRDCQYYYTTNFDDFLERGLKLLGRHPLVVATESQMGLRSKDCQVIKFHGDLDHPKDVVLTETDYHRRLSLSAPMDYKLRADLLGRVVLFVGYSFRDPNVSYLFSTMSRISEWYKATPGTRAYIVVPSPSDFEYKLFGARRISVIPVRSGSIATDTAAVLSSIRG